MNTKTLLVVFCLVAVILTLAPHKKLAHKQDRHQFLSGIFGKKKNDTSVNNTSNFGGSSGGSSGFGGSSGGSSGFGGSSAPYGGSSGFGGSSSGFGSSSGSNIRLSPICSRQSSGASTTGILVNGRAYQYDGPFYMTCYNGNGSIYKQESCDNANCCGQLINDYRNCQGKVTKTNL